MPLTVFKTDYDPLICFRAFFYLISRKKIFLDKKDEGFNSRWLSSTQGFNNDSRQDPPTNIIVKNSSVPITIQANLRPALRGKSLFSRNWFSSIKLDNLHLIKKDAA